MLTYGLNFDRVIHEENTDGFSYLFGQQRHQGVLPYRWSTGLGPLESTRVRNESPAKESNRMIGNLTSLEGILAFVMIHHRQEILTLVYRSS